MFRENQIRQTYNGVASLTFQKGTFHLVVGCDKKIPEDFVKKLAKKLASNYLDNPLAVLFAYPSGYLEELLPSNDPSVMEDLVHSHPNQFSASFTVTSLEEEKTRDRQ